MRKIFTLSIAIVAITLTSHAQGTWTQKANFGGKGTFNAVGFSIGDKGYIGTGYDYVHDVFHKDFWQYNPITDSWTQRADFGGVARYGAVGFSIGSKGYIGTGYTGIFPSYLEKDFWEYDPSSNSWTQKADFGGLARTDAVGFSIDGKGYIGTGTAFGTSMKDFWEYSPETNTWLQKLDCGGPPRFWASGFSIGSKGYVGMGLDGSSGINDLWEYDPNLNTWLLKASLEFGTMIAVSFAIGDKGYIGTGSGYSTQFHEYDPKTNAWTQKADFAGAGREYATGFSIGTKGYIGTGWLGSTDTKDFWEYTPDDPCSTFTATITPLGNLDICETGFVKLVATSGENFQYRWNRNGAYIPAATNQYYKAKKEGDYRVKASNGGECSDVSKKVTVSSSCKLGEKTELTSSLNVFPNPTSGAFTLDLQLGDEETSQAQLQLVNMLGQTISIDNAQLTVENGRVVKEIQLNDDVAEGMYLLKVIINDKIFTSQINLQK